MTFVSVGRAHPIHDRNIVVLFAICDVRLVEFFCAFPDITEAYSAYVMRTSLTLMRIKTVYSSVTVTVS